MKPSLQLIAIFLIALLLYVGCPVVWDYVQGVPLQGQAGQEADGTATIDSCDTIIEPVDTTRQRILLIGDSMSQLLALRLCDYTYANGHSLTCVTWVGSSTRQWAACDTLSHYVRMMHPSHVFVCLGSNELYTGDMKHCRERAMAILSQIGDVPVTWIGPPNWTEDKGINAMLQDLLGTKRYFMTKGVELERQEDGKHPTYAASAVWADSIVRWMQGGHAAHPFVMKRPSTHSRNYRQIIIPMVPHRHCQLLQDTLVTVPTEPAPAVPSPATTDAPTVQEGEGTNTD